MNILTYTLNRFIIVVFGILISNVGWGQLSITSNSANTIDFNSLGSSATATLPSGFRIGTDWSTGTTATTLAYGTSGTGVVTGTSSGGVINWANGVTASSTDRALGFLTTGSFTSPRSIIFAFTNNTGSTVTSIDLSWNYEKFRSGSRAFDWTFFHGSTSTASTAQTSGDQAYAADANNNVISNPPTSTAKSFSITGLSITNGSTYYLRWTYTGNGGSSNAQGLGIDDLSITLVSPVPSIALSSPTIPTSNINGGTTNNIIGAVQLDVTTANATLNAVTFTTSGTYTAADITSTGFKFWLSSSATDISGATRIGSDVAAAGNGSNISISGFTSTITSGTTRFIVLTADLAASPTDGATIGISSTSHTNIGFVSGTKTGTNPVAAGTIRTIANLVPEIALSSPAASSSNITQGISNQEIYRFDLAVTTASATLNSVSITTTGTYAASDLTNFKCWFSTDNTFNAGSDELLSTKSTSLGTGTHAFSSISKTIAASTTGFIFITVDLPFTSTSGNTIAVNAITTSDIGFVTGNKTGTANASGTKTIIDCTPSNVTGLAATSGNTTLNVSWTNPSCFDEIMIVAKPTSTVGAAPSGNGSAYTANLAFGTGGATAFDGTGFVVYKGSTSPQTITGLTNGTTYFIDVFTRKGSTWSSGTEVSATPNLTNATTILWSSSGGSAWLTTGNWTGGAVPTTAQTAQFGSNPTGTTIGINMGGSTNNGTSNQITGAIEITNSRAAALNIGNSSGSTAGTLTLSGVVVNSTENVIVRNNSNQLLTIQANQSSAMTLTLANTTNNVVLINGTGGVTITSVIIGASRNLTKRGTGSGVLTLEGANTYSGLTTVAEGTLRLNRTGGTTIPATNNVTIEGGIFRVSTNQTLNNLTITGGELLVDAGVTLTINGTLSYSAGTITLNGNISYGASSTVTFLNSSAYTLPAGLFTNSPNNVTLNTSGGITLSANATVTGTLTFTSGVLSTSTHILTANTIDRTSGHVNGNLLRTVSNGNNVFHTGSASVYAPVTLNFSGISGTVNITLAAVLGTPTTGSNISSGNNHYIALSKSGAGTFTSYNAAINLANTTFSGDSALYFVRFYNAASLTWSSVDFYKNSHTYNIINQTAFGEIAFGELSTGYKAIQIIGIEQPYNITIPTTTVGSSSDVAAAFQYSWNGLNENMNINAPTDFQVAYDDGVLSAYNSTFSFTTDPFVTPPPVDLYIRYSPTTAIGTNTSYLTFSSTGAATKSIALVSTSIAAQPTTSATVSFSNQTANGVRILFSGGNGTKKIVVVRAASAVTFTPTDATQYSTGINTNFAVANDLGIGNKIVYNGTETTIDITGLSPGTYHVAVYEYNEGTSNSQNYLATAATGSVTLEAAQYANGASAAALTQNFATLVNTGSSTVLPDGWYTNESGTNANTSYTANDGSTSTGDISSFGTGTATDRALGSIRDANLTPMFGTQLINNTGNTVTSVSLMYVGEQWRLGNTGRSDRLDFQYSTDATSLTTGTWNDVNSLDFSSPITTGSVGALDGNNSANRTTIQGSITGISVSNGSRLWIRWVDDDATGNDDALAIDEVEFRMFNTTVTGGSVSSGTFDNINITSNATLSGNVTVTGALFTGTSEIVIGANILTLNGDISGTPTFEGGSGAQLIIGGTGTVGTLQFDQSTPGTTNRINQFTLNRSSATVTLGNTLQIAPNGTVTPTAGTLNANGNLVLVSSSSGTARIAEIQSGADITGNVTVQRFVQGGTGLRGWRLIAAPTTGFGLSQLIDNIFVTGPGGTTNGFDAATTTSSVLNYQESTTGGRGWKSISNISTSFSPGAGLFVFYRGDRTQTASLTVPSTVPNSTVLDFNGTINKGTFGITPVNLSYTNTGSASADGFNLLGNPYPCEINYGSINKTSGVSTTFWTWNPTTGNYVNLAASNDIAIGQGFFVQVNGTSETVTFEESDKRTTTPTAYFKTNEEPFTIKMFIDSVRYDVAWLSFKTAANNDYVFNEDAVKMQNSIFNIAYVTPNQIQVQRNVAEELNTNASDTFVINTRGTQNGNYWLTFEQIDMLPANKNVFLLDLFNNNWIDIKTTNSYAYSINNTNPATFGNRFRLIITDQSSALPVNIIAFKAYKENNMHHVVWKTAEEKNISHYEIQQSTDGINFSSIGLIKANNKNIIQQYTFKTKAIDGKVYYRLFVVDFNPAYNKYSNVVVINEETNDENDLVIYPNPANESITIRLNHSSTKNEIITITDLTGGIVDEFVCSDMQASYSVKHLNKGVYLVKTSSGAISKLVIN